MIDERTMLASEIAELKRLIENTPKRRFLEIMSFESRLEAVQERYDSLPADTTPKPPPVVLTFKGAPVDGNHGITARFGAEVLTKFGNIFASIAASSDAELQSMGPIPKRQQNQLMITGTAIGSFGFQLELPSPEEEEQLQLETEEERLDIIPIVETILRAAAEGTDDEVTEALSNIQQRSIKYVGEFLEALSRNKATCGLSFGKRHFEFRDIQQVEAAAKRFEQENIVTEMREFEGTFNGILPSRRTFEFHPTSGEKSIIYGKIEPEIERSKDLQTWLDKPVIVRFEELIVGEGKPSYRLLSLDDIKLVDED